MASQKQNPESDRLALQDQEGGLDPKLDTSTTGYNPNKRKRAIRRKVYERFYWLRDEPTRQEQEADWEIADNEYGMVVPTIDPDDWRSHLQLPDAFAAIQTQAQETIERKSRPKLTGTDASDEPAEEFANAVMNYNMNNTGFDYQGFLSRLSAGIRGTSFRLDYWRTEKRSVKDPISLNPDGTIKYADKEIIDFDDDYTEWVPAEFIYIDEKAKHIDEAVDMIYRKIINIDEFHRLYDNNPDYFDTEFVQVGGDRSNRSIFRLPQDITDQDVEILRYWNRSIDAWWEVANNITICDQPMPWKHKELPIAVDYQYRMPGRFWGIGIPKVMHMLSEERKSIRNLNMDRQKIIVGGAFLHNNAFDLDDEDEVIYPGRIISVDAQGQPLSNVLQQVQMGDVGASYFKTEEILLEDERRATGIDDRVSVSDSATTATQAAIVKESTLKRINLISITNEMDSVLRLGRLKWSNIQFFYGTPRLEAVGDQEDAQEPKKIYRSVSTEGKKFEIVDQGGKKILQMNDIKGRSAVRLEPKFAKYLEGDFDISVDADVYTPPSKAIDQTKKTELFSLWMSNPASMALMELNGAMADLAKVNNVNPNIWLKNPTGSKADMMMLANSEDVVMVAGQPLDGTPNATEDHTLVHLMFTKTPEFINASPQVKQIIMDHIMQEHDANPATGSAADLMGQYGLNPNPGLVPPGMPGSLTPGGGTPLPPPGIQANTTQPQPQIADTQATNFNRPE